MPVQALVDVGLAGQSGSVSDGATGPVVGLDLARSICARESGLAVVVACRTDGSAHASVVNAGVVQHPVSGEAVVGFVLQGRGRRKLIYLRQRGIATVVFRSGWDWVSVEGDVDLFGPEDQACMPWPEAATVFHSIYAASVGGSASAWATLDGAIEREGHAAVLVRAERVYGLAHHDDAGP
jgi:hypothetical protein